MSGWHTVHVRVNDSSTGQPVPVRIRFEAQGRQLAPLGRCLDFPVSKGVDAGGHVELNGKRWHYIDGTCEIPLPPGEIVIEVSRGPEYRAARHVMQLAPGQISLRLTIERLIDLRKEGWYSGDTRVTDLSPHAALLEGACEDVAVVNLLAHQEARQRGPVTNLLAFSGQQPALVRDGHMVVVNTLNQHVTQGTLTLLNCHRAIYPLRAGDDELDRWNLADWSGQCHRRKTGLVLWSDTGSSMSDAMQSEAIVSATRAQLEIDAFEIIRATHWQYWYHFLNAGVRLPLVAGSGKDSAATAIGQPRTYAQLLPDQRLDYAAWIEAVRAGRTFVTNGPLPRLSVDGVGPGSALKVKPGQIVQVRLEANHYSPPWFGCIYDDQTLFESEKSTTSDSLLLERELEFTQSGWIAATCRGADAFAYVSPIHIEVVVDPDTSC